MSAVNSSSHKFKKLAINSVCLLLGCGWGNVVAAPQEQQPEEEWQSVASLQGLVHEFLEEEVSRQQFRGTQRTEIEVGYVDPRLRLPSCPQQPDLSLNGSGKALGKVQVRVQCAGDRAWTKYIPAEIRVFEAVLVANHNLNRGTLLDNSHFSLHEMDISQLRRTPLFSDEDASGKELKYSLTAGSPLSLEALQLPKVVQRGDLVQLVAETQSLQVRQQAEALEDGEIGKVIDVRNTSSRLVVQAVVVAAGKVKIQL